MCGIGGYKCGPQSFPTYGAPLPCYSYISTVNNLIKINKMK